MPLAIFIVRRLIIILALLLAVSILVFVGCEILPGDVAQVALGQFATPENVAALREQLGLNEPAAWRYLNWLGALVLHGNWGTSIVSKLPVTAMLSERLGNTLMLAAFTTVIAVPTAIALGIAMAINNGGRTDRVLTMIVLAFSAVPEFLVASVAVLFFALHLKWLPTISYLNPGMGFWETLEAMILPAGTLAVVVSAQIARMTRSIIMNIVAYPYIEMAMLKGVPVYLVVIRHALINAIGPIVNVVALNIAYMVSGILVVETVFAYPGLARLMVDAVQSRDFPVVQACALIFCGSYVLLILLADIVASLSDPRSMPARA
ncbi:ABC transporter permease [Neorhizobium sp. NCHU2750]|uniref:ABC transporter permease n=1 Tax=Neorhizobium sp. NCHU2750 TaxID=1825976 RepID=UPI000E71EBEF|nr:peptide/nickel ABC transporter permease [Neorhizobium sp. NCHU2750]